jgi:hypothetical protein
VWIGTRDRRAILGGSKSVVQFYLSMFSLFRVIDAPVKAKLNTITDEFSGNKEFLLGALGFFKNFKDLIGGPIKLRPAELLFLETSSPTSLISWRSWGRDAALIRQNPALWSHFKKWLDLTGNSEMLTILKHSYKRVPTTHTTWGRFWFDKKTKVAINYSRLCKIMKQGSVAMLSRFVIKDRKFSGRFRHLGLLGSSPGQGRPVSEDNVLLTPGNVLAPLGRLSFKVEAAGKLRIFAMVDSWTQSIFKPLHDALFSVLKTIPNDATFDQDAAFKRAILKSRMSGHCYGYDLSSATDRLPIDLQEAILSGLIGSHLSSLWRLILVDRDYYIPANKHGIEIFSVRYAVGQPMGALSSWAMLALCHHAIVQYAFRLIGGQGWTKDYEVLGDDIVIFSKPLALKYVELMDHFGVPLNLAKSVVSHLRIPVVEFAKRTSLNRVDVSPISLKMFLNQDSFAGKIAIFDWFRFRSDKHFVFSNLKTIFKSKRWDDRPLKTNFVILGVFSTLIRKGEIPFVWMVRNWTQTRSVLTLGPKGLQARLSLGWYLGILKRIFWGRPLEDTRPRALFSSEESRRWYQVLLLHQIFSRAKFAFTIDIESEVTKLLLTSNMLRYIDYGEFLVLGSRFIVRQYITRKMEKEAEGLKALFYDSKIFTYDVDELFKVLERVMTRVAIFKISEKVAPKQQKVDTLRILQIFDKLLNSGFKKRVASMRQFELLGHFTQPYIKVDLNDEKIITSHYNFIRDYLPFDQSEFIQNLILFQIDRWNWEVASTAFSELVCRKMSSHDKEWWKLMFLGENPDDYF